MKEIKMFNADGGEVKLFSGVEALNALALIESLNMEMVGDDEEAL